MQWFCLVTISDLLVDLYDLVIHIMQIALLLLCSWRNTDQIELYDTLCIMILQTETPDARGYEKIKRHWMFVFYKHLIFAVCPRPV